jgi:hypothetical protein
VTDFSKANKMAMYLIHNVKNILILHTNGFDGVLVEGWNEGWEDWFGHAKDYVLIL